MCYVTNLAALIVADTEFVPAGQLSGNYILDNRPAGVLFIA